MINRTMKITAIVGVVISVLVSIFVDFDNAEWILLLYGYYPLLWLIICIFTRRYFKDPVWEATLITSPVFVGIFGGLVSIDFPARYVCYSITISLLILEYRIVNKKK